MENNQITTNTQICNFKSLEEANASRRVFTPEQAISTLVELALDENMRQNISKNELVWHKSNAGATEKTITNIKEIL